ncbi:hypothetical protein [Streptomyces sp. NPDC001851]|uniref:hypothetical protein n=1 Tax=Streptomyces sp. NPDC001851 TaxID=3154529 RepID=UPI0033194634
MGTVRLRTLGTTRAAVRRTARHIRIPSSIPRRPPGNALLGVPLSVYDRVRDALGIGSSASRRRS